MIDDRFCIKHCGFGVSRILASLTGSHLAFQDDPVQLWMAPEMLKDGKNPGTKDADIYSLGVVMAETLTGKTPLNVVLEKKDNVTGTRTLVLTSLGCRVDRSKELKNGRFTSFQSNFMVLIMTPRQVRTSSPCLCFLKNLSLYVLRYELLKKALSVCNPRVKTLVLTNVLIHGSQAHKEVEYARKSRVDQWFKTVFRCNQTGSCSTERI